MKHKVKTWKDVYVGLSKVGFNNSQIGELVGCSRSVISNIINGTYRHPHEPPYSGGLRALVRLRQMAEPKGVELEWEKGPGVPTVHPYVPDPSLLPYDPK